MIGLLPAEIRRQVGRKGSFFGAMAWVGLFGVGTLVWAVLDPEANASTAIVNGGGLLLFAATLAAIVVGATAGVYDTAQGTMRYLVLTGRQRWQLVGVRALALPITVAMILLPSIAAVLLAGLVAGGESPSGDDFVSLFYGPWMSGLLYGLLSLAIGTFLSSVGVAIAVAVVANFAGALITALIYEYVSADLASGFFPTVAAVVVDREAGTDGDITLSLAASAVVLAVWIFALLGASIARVYRAEY